MGKVVLTTVGVMGDIPPFLALGRALKARGHNPIVLTNFFHEKRVKQADLSFHPIDTPEESSQFFQDDALVNSPRELPALFRKHFLPKVLSEYEKIVDECRGSRSVIVARATPRIAALMASEKTGVPIVPLFTAPVTVSGGSILTELFSSILADDINRIRQQVSLPPITNWQGWWNSPKRSIAPWPDWFCSSEPSWPGGVETVGFLLDDMGQTGVVPADVEKVLSAGVPPVLITGGTYPALRQEFHEVCVEACQRMGRVAVLVTRHDDSVPHQLPANCVVVPSLPFASVMPRFGAVFHHGGMGTLGRAVVASVPQIILPFGADRPDNAGRLSRLGIAESFSRPNWKPDLLAKALERALTCEQIRNRCREYATRCLRHDAISAACDIVEALLNENALSNLEPLDAPVSNQLGADRPFTDSISPKVRDYGQMIEGLSPEKRALLEAKLVGKRRDAPP